jgi:hypothetical protein
MKLSLFMKLVAGYLVVIGAVSLLMPQAASGGLGQALTAFDLFVARTLGAILITLGLMNWSVSNLIPRPPDGVLWANIFMNVTLGVIDTANILDGTIGPSSWSGIGFHVVFTALFVLYLTRARGEPTTRRGGRPRGEALSG